MIVDGNFVFFCTVTRWSGVPHQHFVICPVWHISYFVIRTGYVSSGFCYLPGWLISYFVILTVYHHQHFVIRPVRPISYIFCYPHWVSSAILLSLLVISYSGLGIRQPSGPTNPLSANLSQPQTTHQLFCYPPVWLISYFVIRTGYHQLFCYPHWVSAILDWVSGNQVARRTPYLLISASPRQLSKLTRKSDPVINTLQSQTEI